MIKQIFMAKTVFEQYILEWFLLISKQTFICLIVTEKKVSELYSKKLDSIQSCPFELKGFYQDDWYEDKKKYDCNGKNDDVKKVLMKFTCMIEEF